MNEGTIPSEKELEKFLVALQETQSSLSAINQRLKVFNDRMIGAEPENEGSPEIKREENCLMNKLLNTYDYLVVISNSLKYQVSRTEGIA